MNLTKEEALKKLDELTAYINGLDKKDKYKEAEELFIKLVNDNLRIQISPNVIDYMNGNNEWVFSINIETKTVWFHYQRFWEFFVPIIGANYQEIKTFMDGMVEKHLNCKGFTSWDVESRNHVKVEKHLNCKGFTSNK